MSFFKLDSLSSLLNGEVRLKKVYLFYGFLIPILVNIIFQIFVYTGMPSYSQEAPDFLENTLLYSTKMNGLFAIFFTLPYSLFFCFILYKSNRNYFGNSFFKVINYIFVLLALFGTLFAVLTSYLVSNMTAEEISVHIYN